jgi:hypothetical protein
MLSPLRIAHLAGPCTRALEGQPEEESTFEMTSPLYELDDTPRVAVGPYRENILGYQNLANRT